MQTDLFLKVMEERKSTARKPHKAVRRQEADEAAINIPVIEEQVNVERRVVETGKVRIRKTVAKKRELVDFPEVHENVKVERIPINQYVETAPPPIRYEGSTMIIPILREEVVVTKRLLLVEELRINKEQIEVHKPMEIPLLKEEIEIERTRK